mgnify:CR=1 FL=1
MAKLKLTVIDFEPAPFPQHVEVIKEMIEFSCKEMMKDDSLNQTVT